MSFSYINHVLSADERLIYRTHVHWIVYLPAMLGALAGLLVGLSPAPAEAGWLVGALLALPLFIWGGILRSTIEIGITSKRVISKHGLIRRETSEIQLSTVEGLSVHQSIPGRILGYGTIRVRGTGEGVAPIAYVTRPERFSRELEALMANHAPPPAGIPAEAA